MEVGIKGTPDEISALVSALQGRRGRGVEKPAEIIREAVQKAIGGIVAKLEDSSLQSSGTLN